MGSALKGVAVLGVAAAIAGMYAARCSAPSMPVRPAPVYAPEAALATFRVEPGFRVRCVAAEPTIDSPVAAVFDEDGRLWVVEMRTYMPRMDATKEDEEQPRSRIVVLEPDGEGGFDSRPRVFLEGLVLPRAVLPCFGGALVIEPPHLVFRRDTNGDGRADEKRVLLSGFTGINPEHAPNGLMYGLDNWVYLSQHNIRMRFDGERVTTERTPGHGQWGITQDEQGRLFYSPNPESLRGDLVPKHYLARNAAQRDLAGVNELISRVQSVWPVRPTPGVNRGYMENVLRADRTLRDHTAACGPVIYNAGAFGPEYRGNAFVCEAAGNLVKRLTITERDGVLSATTASPGREFLASTDERFRPVNTAVGPDGALYIVDMYRGLIQHNTYLTEYLKEEIRARGLELPLGQGRIYRVEREGMARAERRVLSRATDEELVELLSHADVYFRLHAQRLLVERRARGVAERVRALASAPTATTRLHALWTLEGLGELTQDDALGATADEAAVVRTHSLRLLEAWLDDDAVLLVVRALAEDRDRGVRVQAALTAGEIGGDRGLVVMETALARNGFDRVTRAAAVSGLGGRELSMLDRLMAESAFPRSAGERDMLSALADCVLRGSDLGQRAALVERIAVLAERGDGRAERLLDRLRREQRIESDAPAIIPLGREPQGWAGAAAGSSSLASKLVESGYYLSWPGRPRVEPPRRLRPLTESQLALYRRGEALYTECIACHGADGRGTTGQVPSLVGSERAQGPAARAIRVLLHGMVGPMESEGLKFDGSMPPTTHRRDSEIAAILTYIRRAWGNTGDPVAPLDVSAVRVKHEGRTRPWTAEELDALD